MFTKRQKLSLIIWYLDQMSEWDRKVSLGIVYFFLLRSKPHEYLKEFSLRKLFWTIVGAIEYYRLLPELSEWKQRKNKRL